MVDLRDTIIPKSDQLNADDLIGRTLTVTISRVARSDTPEQPIAIYFDGDGNSGKPYLPCKSMRRVLVHVWGPDGQGYIGRSMTLYRDDKVVFGGVAVGGIRISHMSHIDRDVVMALTATRANRKPFVVKPLKVEKQAPAASDLKKSADIITAFDICQTEAEWTQLEERTRKARDWLKEHKPDASDKVEQAVGEASARIAAKGSPEDQQDPERLSQRQPQSEQELGKAAPHPPTG